MPAEYKRKFTTKKIMEMTNLEKLQKEAAAKAQELLKESAAAKTVPQEPQILSQQEEMVEHAPLITAQEEAQIPVQTPSQDAPPPEAEPPFTFTLPPAANAAAQPSRFSEDLISSKPNLFSGFSISILLFPMLYLMLIFSMPEKWINIIRDNLNDFILYASFYVLGLFQVPVSFEGTALRGENYKVILGGDLTAFYSVALLGAFALLYTWVQRTTAVRKCLIFVSFFPLAIFANVSRIVLTIGLALNFGEQSADRYLNGLLQVFVYAITVAGLIILSILLRTEDADANG